MSERYVEREFPWIHRWCRFMGSFPYYVEQQIEKARATNAPPDAITFNHETHTWDTVKDIESPYAARVLRQMAEGDGKHDPGRKKVG